MTDEQMIKFLGLDRGATPAQAIAIVKALPPARRAAYERMATLETEVALWQEGLGSKPKDALIDMARGRRAR